MAERRMFHRTVVESDAFLDMPVGAQALYFHMGMAADDDGFINGPKQILRMAGATPGDLQTLIDREFLLDFDGVVVIRHWLVANSLRMDRLKPLLYPSIAGQIYIQPNRYYCTQDREDCVNLLQLRNEKLSNQCHDIGVPKVRKEKIRKDNITEDMIGEYRAPETPVDISQAESGKSVVQLSQAQVGELLERMGVNRFSEYVDRLAKGIIHGQMPFENHYETILKWWEEDGSVNI